MIVGKKEQVFAWVLIAVIVFTILGPIAIDELEDAFSKETRRQCTEHFNTTEYNFTEGSKECCYEGDCFQPMIRVGGPTNFLPMAVTIAIFFLFIILYQPHRDKE